MINKYNKLEDLGKVTSELVKELIWEDISDNHFAEESDYYENTIIFTNLEVNFTYIDKFDEDEEEYIEELTINSITEYDVEELLKDKMINYSKSNRSESIYIDDVRISLHKRPSYENGGVYYDHKYKNEIILNNEIEIYEYIKKEY